MTKSEPFDIDKAMKILETATRPFAPAALFDLAERGYTAAFQQLVACIISIRTLDEVMLPTAIELFQKAPTPDAVAALSIDVLDRLIHRSTFHRAKAEQIHAIAREVVERWGGVLPCDEEVMLGFKGVGPKCTNLVMGIACGVPRIAVDIHVHRVTNRWGYVAAPTPEKTMRELQRVLPEQYNVAINRYLVPFGKHICTGMRPKCSVCPLSTMCAKVGVGGHR